MVFALSMIISISFILILSSCKYVPTPSSSLVPVKYGGQYLPKEYLLQGYDFWSKYGFEVQHILFSSGTENIQALITGAIDINIGSESKSIDLFNAMGDEAVIIAISQRGNRYSIIVKEDSPISNWWDMIVKKVGIRLGTGAEQVLRQYFYLTGDLKWEGYEWVNLKLEDMAAALEDGSIVAFTAWEPIPETAQVTSNAKVLMSYGHISDSPVLIHTNKEYARLHRKELVAFLNAHLDKVDLINSDVEEASKIAAEVASDNGFDISPGIFKVIFERVDFSLQVDDDVIASLNDTALFMKNIKIINEIPEFYVDTSFLEEAMLMHDKK